MSKGQVWIPVKTLIKVVPIAAFLIACRQSPPATFTKFADVVPPYQIQTNSQNGFDDYCEAALKAESDDPMGFNRVSHTPGQKRESLKKLSGAFAELKRGSNKKFEFVFVPKRPLERHPYLGGWRLLSRAILWKIEDSLETNSVAELVENIKLARTFSTNMLKGGASEANLGITLTDEVRKLLAPRLPEMNPGMLDVIAETYTPLAIRENWIEDIIPNEKLQMELAVQFLQDEYQKSNWKFLNAELGAEARDAVTFLEQLRKKDGFERLQYFQGFAAEIEIEENIIRAALLKSPATRSKLDVPEGRRPWKRFSKAFFRTIRPVLVGADRCKTRTQLLVLECRLRAILARTRQVPENIEGFDKALRTDPYSGNNFGYEAFESELHIYSVGQDQRDNGGKTDEEFLVPDIRIERI